jgi:hypothetical protein
MADQKDSVDGLVIKIPASLLEKQPDEQSKETSKAKNDYNFFTRTGIIKIQVEQNSEHGITQVQSLGFDNHNQRLKIIELLDTPTLYNKFPELLDYIYQLGCERDGEKRYYAAVAVSELATKQPFLDLKEGVILPWAKSDNPWIRISASVALSQVLKHERYKSEVLMLLKHWISIDNPMLTDTALSTFFGIADSHSNETLEAISTILKTDKILHYLSAIDLFGIVYDISPTPSIEKLHSWLRPVTNSDICLVAGLMFLIYIQLDDAAKVEGTRKNVVEMIFDLWENPIMPLHQEIQEQTIIKVEKWAREVIALWNKESPEVLESYLALFHELYWKYKGKRRNRLEYYLQRWERNREREQALANRRRGGASLRANEKISYLDLMPKGSDSL